MVIKPADSETQVILQTNSTSITSLHLTIKGNIESSGILGFGENDSTFYKAYKANSGKVEIKYGGDWYSELCYVTTYQIKKQREK